MALPSKAWVEEDAERRTTWAFCLRTSAGVRMRQETSSPMAEAAEWMKGVGIRGVLEVDRVGLRVWRRDFVPS